MGFMLVPREIYLIESRENSWATNLLCFFFINFLTFFFWIDTWGPPSSAKDECECGIRTSPNRALVLLFREMSARFRPKAQHTTTGHSFVRSLLIFHFVGFCTRFKSPGSMLLFLLCSAIDGKPLDFSSEWRNHTHLLLYPFWFRNYFAFRIASIFFFRSMFHRFLENFNYWIWIKWWRLRPKSSIVWGKTRFNFHSRAHSFSHRFFFSFIQLCAYKFWYSQ